MTQQPAEQLPHSADVCPGFPDRCPAITPVPADPPVHYGGIRCGCADDPSAATAAEELRAAEERVRMGDPRIDIAVRGPLRDLLDAMADLADDYPEMAHDHDRPACDDYACNVMGRGIDLARTINGSRP